MIALLRLGLKFTRVRKAGRGLTTALTILATAVATVVVIAALVAPGVIGERRLRAEARVPVNTGEVDAPVLYEENRVQLGGKHILVTQVARDRGGPLPPGVSEPPARTAWFVSPALRAQAQDERTAAVAFPYAADAAEIDPTTLEDRSDLLAYRVVPLNEASPAASPAAGFGAPILERGGVSWVRGLSAVVFVALPLVAVLWTAARLSSRRKDTRLRSLRILGLTRWNLAQVAATEIAVVSAAGSATGAVAVWLSRPHLDRFTVNGATLAPADVTLLPGALVAVAAVTTLATGIAVTSSWVHLRLGQATPRARAHVVSGRPTWLLASLLLGGLALVVGWTDLFGSQNRRLSLLQPAIPLLGLTLAAGLSSLQQRSALAISNVRGAGAPWQSAFRRLAVDAEGGARPARILCVSSYVLVVTTVVLSSFWVDLGWAAEYRRTDGLALVTVDPGAGTETWVPASNDHSVEAYVPVVEDQAVRQVLIASCAQLEVLNAGPIETCSRAPRLLRIEQAEGRDPTPSASTYRPLILDNPDELSFDGMERVDPSDRDLPRSFTEVRLVYVVADRATLDDFKAREYERDPFARIQASSFDLLEIAPDPGGRWIVVGGLVAMGLGALGAGIASIERALSMRGSDRRFALVGASRRQRRRRRLLELLPPLLPGAVLGTSAGLLAATAYRRTTDSGTVNLSRILLFSGVALCGALLLALVAAPLSRSEDVRTIGSHRD